MSVYTAAPAQIGQQPLLQQPYGYGQQAPWQQMSGGQQPFAQPGQALAQQFGQQQPFGQQMGQQQLPQIVTELALRCATTAVSAVVEQLRFEPQAIMGIQAQGQLPPHLWSNVLVECARRIAPVLHTTLAPIAQGAFSGQPLGQPSYGSPQPYGMGMGMGMGQQSPQYGMGGQQPYGMSQPFGQGFSSLTGTGI